MWQNIMWKEVNKTGDGREWKVFKNYFCCNKFGGLVLMDTMSEFPALGWEGSVVLQL